MPHRRNFVRDATGSHRDHAANREDSDGLRLCCGDAVHVSDAANSQALIECRDATLNGVMEVVGVRLSERVRDDHFVAFDVPPVPIGLAGLAHCPPVLSELGRGSAKHHRVPHGRGGYMHSGVRPHTGQLVGYVRGVNVCGHGECSFRVWG